MRKRKQKVLIENRIILIHYKTILGEQNFIISTVGNLLRDKTKTENAGHLEIDIPYESNPLVAENFRN